MPSIKTLKAFNFQNWIDANRDKLKPPVGKRKCGTMATLS